MPTTHRPRPTPCSHCGDTVLIAERTPKSLLGFKSQKGPEYWLEHADPSPDGQLFDPVDEGCRRERVRGGSA